MTTQKTKLFKRIGLLILSGIFLMLSYEYFFRFVIIELKDKRTEKKLIKNFRENQSDFHALIAFSKTIRIFENITFGPENFISFQLYDTSIDRTKDSETWMFSYGGYTYPELEIKDLEFLAEDELFVYNDAINHKVKNWIIDFRGKTDDPIFAKLLQYNGLTMEQINAIRQKLEKINGKGFNKHEKLITIRYAGNIANCFNYIYPLDSCINKKGFNCLSDNFYWEHFLHPNICE